MKKKRKLGDLKRCHRAELELDKVAFDERRFTVTWACLHSQHAGFPILFDTRAKAEEYRKEHATAYAVCQVVVCPLYGGLK